MAIDMRHYRDSDFDEIVSWWDAYEQCPPLQGMMIEDGTFVLEREGVLLATLTVLYTQSKKISFLEGFCAKPGLDKEFRNILTQKLFNHACDHLRARGFSRVTILTEHEHLMNRYQEMGMEFQSVGLYSLGKGL